MLHRLPRGEVFECPGTFGDLKKLVRRAGLRFLLVVFRTGMLRFLVRLLDI